MKPFGVGEFIYATDGCLMIRVPGKGEVVPDDPGEKAEGMFKDFESDLPWIDVPKLESRKFECEHCQYLNIIEPDGKEYADLKNQHISKFYLRKIFELLPDAKIQLNKNDFGPVKIKFTGGIGLLMPMKKP